MLYLPKPPPGAWSRVFFNTPTAPKWTHLLPAWVKIARSNIRNKCADENGGSATDFDFCDRTMIWGVVNTIVSAPEPNAAAAMLVALPLACSRERMVGCSCPDGDSGTRSCRQDIVRDVRSMHPTAYRHSMQTRHPNTNLRVPKSRIKYFQVGWDFFFRLVHRMCLLIVKYTAHIFIVESYYRHSMRTEDRSTTSYE